MKMIDTNERLTIFHNYMRKQIPAKVCRIGR
jgi:hypothetical protein